MNRKTGTKAQAAGENKSFAHAVRESAQQIWLAGLGAFAKAQDEGVKVFESLVRQGMNVERHTRASAEEKFGEVAGTVGKVAGDLGRQASESWDRLEHVFESRVARALVRMGVPTRREIDQLAERVEKLAQAVKDASKPKAARPVAVAKPKKAAKAGKPAAAAKPKKATKAMKPAAAKPKKARQAAKPVAPPAAPQAESTP